MGRYATKQDRAEVLNRFALPMPSGCWEWQGAIAANGYGMLTMDTSELQDGWTPGDFPRGGTESW